MAKALLGHMSYNRRPAPLFGSHPAAQRMAQIAPGAFQMEYAMPQQQQRPERTTETSTETIAEMGRETVNLVEAEEAMIAREVGAEALEESDAILELIDA